VRCGPLGTFTTMRGYLNLDDEIGPGDGWVRTGDIAVQDADGYLYFVDRARDLVVSGGYNIYSREVEAAILTHSGVADVGVIGVPDEGYGEAVLAFVELKPGLQVSAEEIVDHCRNRIAGYKKPKHVRFVESLPRTATSKVRKGDLRKLAAAEFGSLNPAK
jgi:long-chain acyl-CoA synthetase